MSDKHDTTARHAAADDATGAAEKSRAPRVAAVAVACVAAIGLAAVAYLLSPASPLTTHASQEAASQPQVREASAPDASATATAAAGASATPDAPQRPALVEDDSPFDAGAPTAEVTSDAGVHVVAPEGFAGTTSAHRLDDVVRGFREGGYRLGFALEDLSTGRTLSYGTNEIFYPASSVKAVYCTMVIEQGGDAAVAASGPTIENCLVNSDNDAFRSLIAGYGYDDYAAWMGRFAPESASQAAYKNYPTMTAAGMLSCWKETARFCTSDEPGSSFLADCLSQTHNSCLGGLMRDRYTVWSKPGWYYGFDGEDSAPSTCDCGLVRSDCGDYVVAVLSDAPGDFDALMGVVDALNAAHGKMCGGSSALLDWEGTELS
ncbi:class A beta-lactamase-related serine hydrolase [Olsenella intestinalis]|uniref:class A beta-lactamase-related serine hydrolase n=1 Tax=Olsenella intestinalis TaxID=2930083 RepID=UPI00200E10A1|nr:class A beta-lactamase-related serine hydrolase [Olsenella intestinalis]